MSPVEYQQIREGKKIRTDRYVPSARINQKFLEITLQLQGKPCGIPS